MSSTQKELRIGLVLYGGVSLCIYIFGVVLEFLNFVRGRGKYKDLIEHSGTKPIIDVISGTSAGGINGIFLAKALTTGASLEPLRKLWIEEGDLNKLISTKKDPSSLIDSEIYLDKLEHAFNMVSNTSTESNISTSLLDLFVTATDLDGITQHFIDDQFQFKVTTKKFATVFHFKCRSGEYILSSKNQLKRLNEKRTRRNDFSSKSDKYLAKVAATTSAFPAAFAPVRYTPAEKLEMANIFGSDVTDGSIKLNSIYGDGGMVNNRPFNYTINTIFNRQADTIVNRKLFFVEPDPETIKLEGKNSSTNRIADKNDADGFDSLAGVFKAGLYQNISNDLQRICERNKKIGELKMVVTDLEKELEDFLKDNDSGKLKNMKLYPLFPAYRRFKIDNLIKVILNDIEVLVENGNDKEEVIEALKNKLIVFSSDQENFLQNFDYPFRIRRIRHFINKINDWFQTYKELPEDIIEGLGAYKADLYQYIEFYTHNVWLISQSGIKINFENLDDSFERIKAEYKNIMDVGIKDQTRLLVENINEAVKVRGIKDTTSIDLAWSVLFNNYEFIDMHTYPLIVLSDTGETDPIHVIRISPDIPSRYNAKDDYDKVANKLAGEKLWHFSAFLKKAWRENDIRWGRLDAAELIVRTVMPPEKMDTIGSALINDLCQDINEEEYAHINNRINDDIFNSLLSGVEKKTVTQMLKEKLQLSKIEKEKKIRENYRVGREGLADVSKDYAMVVAGKMLRTVGLMIGKLPAKTSSQLLQRLVTPSANFISKLFNYIYYLTLAIKGELKPITSKIFLFVFGMAISLLLLNIFDLVKIENPLIWSVIVITGIWIFLSGRTLKLILSVLTGGLYIGYLYKDKIIASAGEWFYKLFL